MIRVLSVGARVIGGVGAAFVCGELALRLVASPGVPPYPNIREDSFDDRAVSWSQVDEGVSNPHFTVHGGRLTGNPPMRRDTTAVIIGDSYVVAQQVGDRRTMGSRLEALAREHGIPLDVRQYGWPGASPAQFLHVADDIRNRWRPLRVFVVLSSNDFNHYGLIESWPSYRVDPAGALRIVGERAPETGPARGPSTLLYLLEQRRFLLARRLSRQAVAKGTRAERYPVALSVPETQPPDSAEYERAPRAVIRALAERFGRALTVVYLAEPGIRGDSTPDRSERLMLQACALDGVDCASTRAAMVAAHREGHVSMGLGVARLPNGHLNPLGHDLVARLMWERLSRSIGVSPATR